MYICVYCFEDFPCFILIISSSIQPLGNLGRNQSPVR